MTLSRRDVDLRLSDRRLRGCWIEATSTANAGLYAPTLVFLHEALGCVELWRSFPEALCRRTGLRGFVFDRTGYGRSSGWPAPPGGRYMDIEADLVLPQVLDAAGIEACLLVGHSNGGTIALNFASAQPPLLRGIVTIGAHAITEPRTLSSIRQAREAFLTTDLRERLAGYHGENVDGAFWLWVDAWLTPGFQPMDAPGRLPRVRVPVLGIQGEHDEYATVAQLHAIAGGVSGRCETRLMPACGHGPHLQDEATAVEAIARFVATLWRGPGAGRAGALALAVLLSAASVIEGQPNPCSAAAVQAVLDEARHEEDRADDAAAAARLHEAAASAGACQELGLASLAVDGWVEARRLAATGGAPDELTRIRDILERIAALRAGRPSTALLAQLAAYAEAVLRAAVAAAQDERDEMQLFLTHAGTLAESLRLADYSRPWPLPLPLVEAELWLEVDRFNEARDAFARVSDAGLAARVGLGTGQVMERLADVPAACAAYGRAAAGALAPGPADRVRLALSRLNCPR
jgi:pimeloyl-ACP methyl ester carboxylesterase